MPILSYLFFTFERLKLKNMEVKVYVSQKAWREGKPILCRRIDCVDVFDFHSAVSVLRSLFGSDCIIVFVCV